MVTPRGSDRIQQVGDLGKEIKESLTRGKNRADIYAKRSIKEILNQTWLVGNDTTSFVRVVAVELVKFVAVLCLKLDEMDKWLEDENTAERQDEAARLTILKVMEHYAVVWDMYPRKYLPALPSPSQP
ncbi:unnamed protein product [Clonostachys rosea]|uniref:NWD NACHT-NTPase N-terminal domain-containing protein n=1 Tax=Bionectria ochroleuca TaxID=29856 RepID=A0ABY6UCM2_BIOOC|nr:unnamed protein product [Clonostachys rosea]